MTQVAFNPLFFLGTINGVPIDDPADSESAFSVEYNDDRVTVVKGMYGQGSHEINVATDTAFTLVLKAKSDTNRVLSELERAHAQFSIGYVNKNTNVEAAHSVGRAAMVMSVPAVGGGTSAADKTWVISSAETVLIHDGHRQQPGTV